MNQLANALAAGDPIGIGAHRNNDLANAFGWLFEESLTPWLTGAGSRRLKGTNIGHENAEGMAYVGVRVEPTVRLGREVEGGSRAET